MKKLIELIPLLLLLITVLTSCEVEAQEAKASQILLSAEAEAWMADALEEEDIEGVNISPSNLYNGTSSERFTKIKVKIDNKNYLGYQWVKCKFNLTSSADAKLTLKTVTRLDGELSNNEDMNTYSLVANETTLIELMINVPAFEEYEEVELEIIFESALDFTPEESERVEGEEYVDFASWVLIEYELSELTFYGAQIIAS